MNGFKIALVQQNAVSNDLDKNRELGLKYVEEAKRQGADLVLFPEMWSTGYSYPFLNAVDEQSEFIRSFRKAAEKNQIGVAVTYLSKGKNAPRNSALILDRSGQPLMKYSKVHTCDFADEAALESGDEFLVCDFDGIKLGVMICYDREFPESARVLMLKGAELILVPNACDMNPARLNQLSARAFENMTGVAMANYPGAGWGNSCAYSPVVFNESGYVDNTVFMADDKSQGIFTVEFDMDAIRSYRQRETWGNAYRKVKSYGILLSPEVKSPFIRNKP
jgi:Predicted amidohydrolase